MAKICKSGKEQNIIIKQQNNDAFEYMEEYLFPIAEISDCFTSFRASYCSKTDSEI